MFSRKSKKLKKNTSPIKVDNHEQKEFPHTNISVTGCYNFKGGVGKTITAINLAIQMSLVFKEKILLVDCDAQCNLTFSLKSIITEIESKLDESESKVEIAEDSKLDIDEIQDEEVSTKIIQHFKVESEDNVFTFWKKFLDTDGMQELSNGRFNDIIHTLVSLERIKKTNVYLLNGSHRLFNVDHWIVNRQSSLQDRFKFINMLVRLAHRSGFGYIVIDLNPGDMLLNRSILCRCDHIIVPTFPDQSSISSTIIFIEEIYNHLQEFCNGDFESIKSVAKISAIVINKFKSKRNHEGKRVATSLHLSWVKILQGYLNKKREHSIKLTWLSPQFESRIMKRKDCQYSLINNAGDEQWKCRYFERKLVSICNDLYD